VIADADAVIDPLAMVIEFLDALVANVAVARITREYCFTCWTEALWVTLINQLAECQPSGSFDDSWV
jgi:hypothetical protein